jgi:hypothetical protein
MEGIKKHKTERETGLRASVLRPIRLRSIYEKNRNSNGQRLIKSPLKRLLDEAPTDLLRLNSLWMMRMMATKTRMTIIMMKYVVLLYRY